MKKSAVAFVDVDTQFDFIHPEGNLYVSGAETLIPNLKTLTDYAHHHHIPVIASVDAHLPGDKEFDIFPPHCLKGSAGQAKIDETLTPGALLIANGPQSQLDLTQVEAVVLEKNIYSLFDNPNTPQVLETVNADTYVVFGVATDYCVRAAALGLRERGYQVQVVTDAIKAVTPEGETKALAEMQAAGITFTTTAAVTGG